MVRSATRGRSKYTALAPLFLFIPALSPGEAQARIINVQGWQCTLGGVGISGERTTWSLDCVSNGSGGSGGGGSGRPDDVVGGGGGASNPTAEEQETDDKTDASTCGETSGNPVVLYTGNKVEPELDFATQGEMALHLRRTYNRLWTGIGLFGKHWLSSFDYSLAFSEGTAWAQRPDGRRIKFRAVGGGRWNADIGGGAIHIAKNGDGTYTLFNDERGTETYNADGYITQRVNEQGVKWTFAYTGKHLQRVTHSSGRYVQFTWTSGQLTQVTDPAGNAYKYTYTPDAFGAGRGRLASTVLSGAPSTTVVYHYEDSRYPGALTGKSFNGVRYSTFAYDDQGRATLSEHAGGVQRYTFSYAIEASQPLPVPPPPPPPGGFLSDEERGGYYCTDTVCMQPYSSTGPAIQSRPTRFRVVETNPLGRQTTHLYEDGRKVSVTGHVSPSCPASYRDVTYDASGFEDIVKDNSGQLTDFDHDTDGRVVKRVEAVGTPVARTTQQEWDTARNRLLRVTVPGDREIRHTWTSNGRLASTSETNLSAHGAAGAVQSSSYQYTHHANGLLATMTVDGPLPGDTVVFTYSATGDFVQVRNAAGHATSFAGHNALGQPARITGPAGAVLEFEYDARGRVVIERTFPNDAPAEVRHVYGASGLLEATQTPDGNTVLYHYDAARRLVQEDMTEPDGSYAVRRYTYNAMSQPIKVEVGRDP